MYIHVHVCVHEHIMLYVCGSAEVPLGSSDEHGSHLLQGQFRLAMQLVGGEFTERVKAYKDVWLPARTIVHKALTSRHQVCTWPTCSIAHVHV